MTWEIITDYSKIRPGQKVDGAAWDDVTGTRLTTFHGVVLDVQEITEGQFEGGTAVTFERDERGGYVPGVIITTPDTCSVYVWADEEAAPAEVKRVIEVWTTGTRYYQFSTRTFPVRKVDALAMLADGRAKLVDRPDFLTPRR